MTETKQTSTTKTDRRLKQGATDTAADKMMKVLEAEAATQKTAI